MITNDTESRGNIGRTHHINTERGTADTTKCFREEDGWGATMKIIERKGFPSSSAKEIDFPCFCDPHVGVPT